VDITHYQLYNISSSPSEWTQRFNGLVNYDQLGNTVSFRSSPILGQGNSFVGLTGDIAEVIIYGTALTPAQRDTVNTYLGNKYNLYTEPPVPTSLVATSLSPDQISLQWSAPPRSDHVSYLIERSTDGVNFAQIAAVSDSLDYIDTGSAQNPLSPGTAYYYEIQAQGYAGTSALSLPSNAVTMPSSGTDMPFTGMRLWLKADAGLGTGLVSSWIDQSGNGNNAGQASASNEPTLVAAQLNGLPVVHFNGSQSLNLPNVMNGVSAGEIFAVVRSTGSSCGLWAFGPVADWYPNNGNGIIYEDFGTSNLIDLGKPAVDITHYQLYNISSSPSEWTQRFNGLVNYDQLGNTVSFRSSPILGQGNSFVGLTGDIAEVIIYDHALNDAQRQTVAAYLGNKYGLYTVPQVPASLLATPLSASQVSLQWQAPLRSDRVDYLVERSTDGVNFTQVADAPGTQSYIDTGLNAGTPYTYRIRAQGYAGVSGYSAPATASTLSSGTDMPFTGMRLWLKADAGLGLAGPVSTWQDQSGSGNQAIQTTLSQDPQLVANVLNGYPVVRFT